MREEFHQSSRCFAGCRQVGQVPVYSVGRGAGASPFQKDTSRSGNTRAMSIHPSRRRSVDRGYSLSPPKSDPGRKGLGTATPDDPGSSGTPPLGFAVAGR